MDYQRQVEQENTLQLRGLLQELPAFLQKYFQAIDNLTAPRTRVAYAYDLRLFFQFVTSELMPDKQVTDLKVEVLDQIKPDDIRSFLQHIKLYGDGTKTTINSAAGQMRKLASIRSMYGFYFRNGDIETNPAVKVEMPKRNEKPIVRMDPSEIQEMLEIIETGRGLTERQLRYHKKTKVRDVAIVSLLLGTGIRVSECVGINLSDMDLKRRTMRIVRKGGDVAQIYFSDEVLQKLTPYLEARRQILPEKGSEDAFFLSSQRQRMTARSIENMVKKYAKLAAPVKTITPHKLRSTFGTNLYRQTGDIYLVAGVLGHKDVNTTRRHYADQDERRRRAAAEQFQLVPDDETTPQD